MTTRNWRRVLALVVIGTVVGVACWQYWKRNQPPRIEQRFRRLIGFNDNHGSMKLGQADWISDHEVLLFYDNARIT